MALTSKQLKDTGRVLEHQQGPHGHAGHGAEALEHAEHEEGQGPVKRPQQHQDNQHPHDVLLIAQDGIIRPVGQQGEQDLGAVQGGDGDQVEQAQAHRQHGDFQQEIHQPDGLHS